jgi:hypothetical protein
VSFAGSAGGGAGSTLCALPELATAHAGIPTAAMGMTVSAPAAANLAIVQFIDHSLHGICNRRMLPLDRSTSDW